MPHSGHFTGKEISEGLKHITLLLLRLVVSLARYTTWFCAVTKRGCVTCNQLSIHNTHVLERYVSISGCFTPLKMPLGVGFYSNDYRLLFHFPITLTALKIRLSHVLRGNTHIVEEVIKHKFFLNRACIGRTRHGSIGTNGRPTRLFRK